MAGYKQELRRDFNLFTNSAISFSIISILTGITSESSRRHQGYMLTRTCIKSDVSRSCAGLLDQPSYLGHSRRCSPPWEADQADVLVLDALVRET